MWYTASLQNPHSHPFYSSSKRVSFYHVQYLHLHTTDVRKIFRFWLEKKVKDALKDVAFNIFTCILHLFL